MGLPAEKLERKFTYFDYISWEDSDRWEIIDGEAYNMVAAPNRFHQAISAKLLYQIMGQLEGKTCEVYHAPFDVRLPIGNQKEEEIENVVQPDLSIICDPTKLDEKGCLGAPDLIIEILSPFTSRKDKKEKFFLYERTGVKEYWLVSPDDMLVSVYILGHNGKYGRPGIYTESDTVEISIIEGLKVDLNPVFSAILQSAKKEEVKIPK